MIWERDGYTVLPDVLTPAECRELILAAQWLEPARAETYEPAMQPHREQEQFLATMRRPALVEAVEHLVGGPASGLQSVFYYAPPGVTGFAPHRDNAFVEAPPDNFVSAWIPLVDVSVRNGCLRVWPGSHRFGALPSLPLAPTETGAQDPNANRSHALLPAGHQHLDLELPRGSVVLMHGDLVHSSHANDSDGNRFALLLTYIRAGAPFRPGQRAQRAEVELHPVTT